MNFHFQNSVNILLTWNFLKVQQTILERQTGNFL